MRSFLKVILILGAGAVVAAAALPLWLGPVLHVAGRSLGFTFSNYERLGYARFALEEVEVVQPRVRVTAARLEADTPLVWLFRRWTGNSTPVRVSTWSVEVQPRVDGADAVGERARPPMGAMRLRGLLRKIAGNLDRWIPVAEVGAGSVTWDRGELEIDAAEWKESSLDVPRLRVGDFEAVARIAFLPSGTIEVTTRTPDEKWSLKAVSDDARIEGELRTKDQAAPFSANFLEDGWMPDAAHMEARDWKIAAADLGLADRFAAVHGDARIDWKDRQFETVLALEGEPLPDTDAPLLSVELRGRGDTESMLIESLKIEIPGVNAVLAGPVEIDRQGHVLSGDSEFTLAVDLAQVPWVEATGVAEGRARLSARENAWPKIDAGFSGKDVAWRDVRASAMEVKGVLDWPVLEVEAKASDDETGAEAAAKAILDFERRELSDARLSGSTGHGWAALLVPALPAFRFARFDAKAHGPFDALEHSGTLEVVDVGIPGLKTVGVDVAWTGVGDSAEIKRGAVRAGGSEILVSGRVTREGAKLESLRFTQSGNERLKLMEPAQVNWSDGFAAERVRLASGDSALEIEVSGGGAARFEVAVRNIPSEWWTDFVAMPATKWSIATFDLRGALRDEAIDFQTSGAVSIDIGSGDRADLRFEATGDNEGVALDQLRVARGEEQIFTAGGRLPLSVRAEDGQRLAVVTHGPLELRATSSPNPGFWERLKELTGVELIDPSVEVDLSGTWSEPRGTLSATASRVTVDNAIIDFPLPRIESLEIVAEAGRDKLSLERLSLLVGGQPVRASGSLPVGEGKWSELAGDPVGFLRSGAELHVEIEDAALAAVREYLPAFLASEGSLRVNADIGPGGAINGVVELSGASTRPLGPLGVLQQISADLRFSGRSVELRRLEATSGGQPLRMAGSIELPADAPPQFNVTLKGTNLPLVRRTGLLLRGDIDLQLKTGAGGVPVLGGTATLHNSLYLSDTRALVPSGGGGVMGRPPYFSVQAEPFAKWRLALDVRGDRFLRVRTAVFTGVVSTRFRIAGSLAEPRATGEATVEQGRVIFPFASFAVQNGSARLTEANPFEPQLSLVGTSRMRQFDLRVELDGTASDPILTFSSSPPLGSDVLLAMVMAGEPPRSEDEIRNEEPGQASRKYARLGTFFGQGILRNLGGDPADSERLSVTTGSNISLQGRETFDIEYRFDRRFSVVGEYDEFDEFNAGVKWWFVSNRRERADDSGESERSGERAKIEVSGLGWLADWEQRRSLERLLGGQLDGTLDANAVEDAAVLLLSALADDGYPHASLDVRLTSGDGTEQDVAIDLSHMNSVPRPLEATRAEFNVNRGVRQLVDTVDISGLTVISGSKARRYFKPDGLLPGALSTRVYTPSRISRAADRLLEDLHVRGYAEAKVRVADVSTDEESGKVSLSIVVEEGPRWEVRAISAKGTDDPDATALALEGFVERPWSRQLQQDIREAARRLLYNRGYPDAEIDVAIAEGAGSPEARPVDVTVAVNTGEQVTLGEVRIEGAELTRESVIRRRIAAQAGDLFNPIPLERSRFRLSRLGIFDSVEMRVEPDEGPVRNVVYTLTESQPWGAALMLGYGSYERFRAGVELNQRNLFGLAHHGRIELVKSVKSTRGELSYTVPEIFGESIDGTARLFGLERQETSFLRNEIGANVALRRPLRRIEGEASVGYTFQSLRNRDNELGTAPDDLEDVTVASIDLGLSSDRRDNPLRPRRGVSWFGRAELASRALGGESEFQRFVIGGSYHAPLGSGRWFHFGLGHGVVTTFGSEDDSLLPVNKLFFPGGDGSIRGYKSGEAAPRGADGKFIGAKSYLQASFEFEQALTGSLSIVAFLDALGTAARLADYPFGETLYSAGLGLRYHTIVGPIRLGYGHNLNPRVGDPSGTLYFSVGFPF